MSVGQRALQKWKMVASRVGPGPNSPEVHEGPVEGDEEFRQRRQWWWGTTRLHEALDAL
jgi:hypothetical protein